MILSLCPPRCSAKNGWSVSNYRHTNWAAIHLTSLMANVALFLAKLSWKAGLSVPVDLGIHAIRGWHRPLSWLLLQDNSDGRQDDAFPQHHSRGISFPAKQVSSPIGKHPQLPAPVVTEITPLHHPVTLLVQPPPPAMLIRPAQLAQWLQITGSHPNPPCAGALDTKINPKFWF